MHTHAVALHVIPSPVQKQPTFLFASFKYVCLSDTGGELQCNAKSAFVFVCMLAKNVCNIIMTKCVSVTEVLILTKVPHGLLFGWNVKLPTNDIDEILTGCLFLNMNSYCKCWQPS